MSSHWSNQFTADKWHLAVGYFFQQSFGIVWCNYFANIRHASLAFAINFSLVLFVVSDKGMRNLEFMGENLGVDPESLEKQSLNVSKTSLSLERSAIFLHLTL